MEWQNVHAGRHPSRQGEQTDGLDKSRKSTCVCMTLCIKIRVRKPRCLSSSSRTGNLHICVSYSGGWYQMLCLVAVHLKGFSKGPTTPTLVYIYGTYLIVVCHLSGGRNPVRYSCSQQRLIWLDYLASGSASPTSIFLRSWSSCLTSGTSLGLWASLICALLVLWPHMSM